MKRCYRSVLGVLAVAAVGLTGGLAIANDGEREPKQSSPEAGGALERYCDHEESCAVVDVDAGLRQGEKTLSEDLARYGKSPEECPAASEVLSESGHPADAFIGRCPTADEAIELAESAPGDGELDRARGGAHTGGRR
jgi:hypothetical protein